MEKTDIYNRFANHIIACYENYYPHKEMVGEGEDYRMMKKTLSNSSDVIFLCDIPSKNYLMVSDNCEHILGVTPEDFIVGGITTGINLFPSHQVNIIANNILPKMFSYFDEYGVLNQSEQLRANYTTLVKCRDNSYRWFLHQVTIVEIDEKGMPIKALKVLTDINELKKGDNMDFYMSKRDDRSTYKVFFSEKYASDHPKIMISNREKEVLQLISQGHSSKKIAGFLNISENTVNNHRKNMLSRSHINSTGELVKEAFANGLIN